MSGLYDKTTCFEFHQLLVSTLFSFGKVLEGYADAHGKCFEDLVDRAEQVYTCGTLLWLIGYSQILHNHLEVLRKKGWLHLPTNSKNNLDQFFRFTYIINTKDQVIVQPTDEVNGDMDEAGSSDEGRVNDCEYKRGEDKDEHATKDQVIVQPTDEVDGGADRVDDCGNQGGKDENEEFKEIADKWALSDNRDLAKSFPDWICLQVDHFQAPRKITTFMMCTWTPHINLTLLAVRVPTPKPADAVMEPWHETIKDLCIKSNKVEPEETIRILQETIDQGKRAIDDSCDVAKTKNSIFHKFNAKTYQYTAAIHCKTALASMNKFPGAMVCDDTKSPHSGVISLQVSL